LIGGLTAYAIFFLWVPGLFAVQANTVNRLPEIASLSMRDVIWRLALDYIVAHPFLGIGPMHYAYDANPVAAHPHMSVLQWAAEWGVPSMLLVVSVVLYAGISYLRQLRAALPVADTQAYTLRLALFAALVAAGTQSLVDGVIVMPYSQTLLAVVCGWALGIYQECRKTPSPANVGARWPGVAATAVAVALLVWSAYPEVLDVAERQKQFVKDHPGQLLLPRFWAQGWITR
jgi:hypothetical protein